ncbi:MAG: sigma 54-interacting transcriptional regulator [Kofleriaceae bacterium]
MTDRRNTFSGATLKDTASGGSVVLMARTTLVFYHRDGAITAHLEKGRSLIVGRAAPSEIEIHDLNLSRQHARFSWDDHGLWVEDLGSTNGTKKNGEPVRDTAGRVRIGPGDEIAVGPVKVSIHVLSSIDEELRGFDGHDRFLAALADELTRARTFARPLALCMVRGNSRDGSGHVSRWGGRVRTQLRPVDRVGIYGPHAVLVSLPETTAAGAQAFALTLTGGTPPLVTTVVAFPEDGASVEELISAVQSPKRAASPDERATSGAVIAKSAAMKAVMATVKKVAPSTIAVLITGETGTGKEVLARAIHDGGARKKMPMRSINCAAIPGTLIESVLFGHEHGAFTGADKQAKGIFEQAHGGTVLLDEIGELAPSAQAALLRVLETKKVTRVGGDKEIDVDVRVIAATHRDLEAMVEAGRFRQDLLYRLNTMTLRLPPLRERTDEIKPLAERFLQEAAKQTNNDVRSIDPKALAALEAYSWPGNVRELRNAVDRAVALAENKTVMLADLTDRIRGSAKEPAAGEISAGDGALPSNYKDHLRKYEAELIVKALHKHGGNQTEAAKALGLPLRTLVHKIQTYGIKKKFDR